MKVSFVALILAVVSINLHGQSIPDITIPYGNRLGESLVLAHPSFIAHGETLDRFELDFDLIDNTTSGWKTATIHLEMGGTCNDGKEIRQWAAAVFLNAPLSKRSPEHHTYTGLDPSLDDKVRGCRAELIKANVDRGIPMEEIEPPSLILVSPYGTPVRRETVLPVPDPLGLFLQEEKPHSDLTEEIVAAKTRREATERQLAEKRAAELRRLTADRKKAQAEQDAALAKARTEEEAKKATLQVVCSSIYESTANKRLGDLTVKESQQVQACQTLGMYHSKCRHAPSANALLYTRRDRVGDRSRVSPQCFLK